MADSTFDTNAFGALHAQQGTRLGHPLIALAETGSTNDDALEAARKGASSGTLFVADAQTKGRGRRGHSWTSPPGENLMFSLVLRPEVDVEHAVQLTLVAGAAVRTAVAPRTAATVQIKWPNDVVVERRKLAGILVESQITGRQLDAVIVGIGINVLMQRLPADIAAVATSLALLGDPNPSREAVLADVLFELEQRLASFAARGLAACIEEVRSYDALAGSRVTVEGRTGVADGIDDTGALLVRDDAGQVSAVTAGTVEW